MSRIRWTRLHPATRASISLHGAPTGEFKIQFWSCGCGRYPSAPGIPPEIELCEYHNGFDDGAEAAS